MDLQRIDSNCREKILFSFRIVFAMKMLLSFLSRLDKISTRTWFWVVLAVAAIQRLLLWLFYPVVPLNDTGSYRRSADAILGGWVQYDGTRTPGYPAFMALVGSDERVYIAQLLLGLGITLLFFYIGWRITGRGWFGALAALLHTFNAQQFLFEADLMTETLATFWLALTFAGMAYLLEDQPDGEKRKVWKLIFAAALTGLAAGLSILTRPLYIYLPFWIAFFLAILWRLPGPGIRWTSAAVALLPGLILAGWWVNFIHDRFNMWSLSAMTGYHLIQHTGVFFEYVSDKYASLRDTYLRFRDARIAEYGTQTNAIWDAIPEMQKATGESFYGLSRLVQKISVQLILEHPLLYARNVVEGWYWFWKVPVYWSADAIQNPVLLRLARGLILVERGLLFGINMIFIFGSIVLVVVKKFRQMVQVTPFIWFSIGAVWIASVLQSMLDHGDNPRFLIPMQSLVVLIVLWWFVNFIFTRSRNAG
jgi:4-amino-4-deoxy-L-arabinose transferase-like glycosyltransferase